MFVSKSQRTGAWRVFSVLFFTAGFILSSGVSSSAVADNRDTELIKKPAVKASHKRSVKAKRRVAKSSTFNKARRALNRSQKQSLRRLPAARHKSSRSRHNRHRGLHPRLNRLLAMVKRHYGKSLTVSSGCRSHRHNRRVGGAKRSMHLRCMAADFKVAGVSKARLRRFVSGLPGRGGVGTYCGKSIVHLDVGPRRSWYHGCRKRRKRRS